MICLRLSLSLAALLAAGSSKAVGWKTDIVDPLRKSMMTGYALGGVFCSCFQAWKPPATDSALP